AAGSPTTCGTRRTPARRRGTSGAIPSCGGRSLASGAWGRSQNLEAALPAPLPAELLLQRTQERQVGVVHDPHAALVEAHVHLVAGGEVGGLLPVEYEHDTVERTD